MLPNLSTDWLMWIILWRKAWNHQNAICPSVPPLWLRMLLCSNRATEHLTKRKFSIIIMINSIAVVYKWASLGPTASHDPPQSALAYPANDLFWQKMARVCILRHQMTFVLPSVTESSFVAAWLQIHSDLGFLWMAVVKMRHGLQKLKISSRQLDTAPKEQHISVFIMFYYMCTI